MEVLQFYSTRLLYQQVLKRLTCQVVAVFARVTLRRAQDVTTDGGLVVWGLKTTAPILEEFVAPQLLRDSLQDCTA
jgi:hypothetical protein